MRTRHWLTGLMSCGLALAGAQQTIAQNGPGTGYYPPPPGASGDPYAAPAYYGSEFQPGYPPDANAWPGVSPFMAPEYERTFTENGFWFNRQLSGPKKYFFTVEGLITKSKRPDDQTIGDDSVGNAVLPDGLADDDDTAFDNVAYRRYNLGEVNGNPEAGGIRARLGYFNADGTGASLTGFWQDEGTASILDGNPRVDINDPETYFAGFGIPLAGADIDGDNFQGATATYDLFYRVVFETQTMGLGANYYFNSIVDSDSIQFRPLAGIRYLHTKENLTIRAATSGFEYTFDQTLVPDEDDTFTILTSPHETYIRSWVHSHYAGPEIGFRVDLGSDRFLVWGETKLGLLANHNKRAINGYNVGAFALLPQDPTVVDTRFNAEDRTTSVSPIFEQSIFLRSALLSYIPGIRSMSVFEKAQFQVGYTFILIGEAFRPGDTIQYNGFPQFPTLKDERSAFSTNQLSLGVEWEY